MNYNWTVTNLYTIDANTEVNYVVNALYNVTAMEQIEDEVYTATLSNTAQFEVKEGDTFVPYVDLTNDLVIEWIQTGLGQDGVYNIEASAAGMVNSQINPPVSPENTPLPTNFN